MNIDYLVRDVDIAGGVAHAICFGRDLPEGMPVTLPLSLFIDGNGRYAEGAALDALVRASLPVEAYRAKAEMWAKKRSGLPADAPIVSAKPKAPANPLPFVPVPGSDVYMIRSLHKIGQLPVPVEVL